MRYKVTHRTTYSGSDPVSVGHNQAWLEFRQCERQQVESFSLQISPEPSVKTRRVDAFGNPVHMFSFSEAISDSRSQPSLSSLSEPTILRPLRRQPKPQSNSC
jgi:transglutaminase-like putative cysteine protease